jgi:hypothetical protein
VSVPDRLEVDAAAQKVAWRDAGEAVCVQIWGAFAARYDPDSDRLLVLTGKDGGAVQILSRKGERLATVEPPAGYAVSHFADAAGATIVCQGEARDGAWWDWHFTVDAEAGEMRRAGPAY